MGVGGVWWEGGGKCDWCLIVGCRCGVSRGSRKLCRRSMASLGTGSQPPSQ